MIMLIFKLFGQLDTRTVLVMIVGKLALEFIFLVEVSLFLKVKVRFSNFLFLQFIYPVYVVFVGIGSGFMPYVWKGRQVVSSKL